MFFSRRFLCRTQQLDGMPNRVIEGLLDHAIDAKLGIFGEDPIHAIYLGTEPNRGGSGDLVHEVLEGYYQPQPFKLVGP